LLVVAVGTALVTMPTVLDARARERQSEKRGYELMIPALTTIEGRPEDRPGADRVERDEVMPIVDKILALDADDVPARLLKAALLFDGDRRIEAAEQIESLASRRGGAYFAALARRYREAEPGQPGAGAVRLAGMPVPGDAAECYAEGFQRLRTRTTEDLLIAQRVLEPVLDRCLPARDLHLLALLAVANSKTPKESQDWFRRAYEEGMDLERAYGQPTARTRHAIGSALVGMKRYADAIAPLEESLRLRPDRHNVLQNLAIAKRRTGKLDEAEALLRRAHELKPSLWNTCYTLAQLLADRREFDAARSFAERVPDRGDDGQGWKKAVLLGDIARRQGLDALGRADPDPGAARQFGLAALQHYSAAKEAGAEPELIEGKVAWATALIEGDASLAWRLYVPELAQDPAARILAFSRLLPANGIPLEHMNELRLALVEIGLALNPDSSELARERGRLGRVTRPNAESGK
jgi:tetratricopeptide (TPR) repeat protein